MSRARLATACFGIAVLVMVGSMAGLVTTTGRSLSVDRLQAAGGWADETTCVTCHEEARMFGETGHARTLQRADVAASRGLLEVLSQSPAVQVEKTRIDFEARPLLAVNQSGGFRSAAELGWCFGSGRHARTWVGTNSDSLGITDLLEFRWTWYRSINGFDVTPGQPDEPGAGYYAHLGLLFDHPKARRCFGCHASRLPIDAGRIVESEIHAGVTCQRCHGPRAEHVSSRGQVGDEFWSHASRDASVARCAECHRSVDEQDPTTITPGNPDITRFQPVGLSQSACFQQSSMTCVTCHDPHRPLEAQDSAGIWQCLQCHKGGASDRTACSAGHRADCLRCHMPKVSMDRPIQFTDHWIRVPEAGTLP